MVAIFAFCASFNFASCNEVQCDSIEVAQWSVGTKRTCYFRTTAIERKGFAVSSSIDASVGVIDFQDNKKIIFLPENTGKIFSKLLLFNAAFCAIEAITRDNFRGLRKLEKLYLNENRIKMISIDTFQDLESLEVLYLSENTEPQHLFLFYLFLISNRQ